MKTLLCCGLAWLVTLSCLAQCTKTNTMKAETELKKKIALACKLTDRGQIQRMNELHQTIFKKVDRTIERANSYELIFQRPDSLLSDELTDFIKFERLCCPWLLFQLTYQPENGPISLKMGNSTETKEMVKLVMELDKLATH